MKKFFVLLVFSMLLFTCQVYGIEFSDVNSNNWFYEDICSAVEKGYINGFEDGTFRPNDIVTRGEFYKMLVEAKGEKPDDKDNASHWAFKYAKFLRFNGDTSVETFGFEDKILRKEVIRNVLYFFGIENTVEYHYYENSPFVDMPKSTIYCYDGFIQNAYQLGIVYGNENYINPNEPITRAEAVSIIERALKIDNWEVPQPDILRGATIVYNGEGAETYLNDICSAFSKFPDYIIDSIVDNDCEIIVTDEIIEHHYVGLYSVNDKSIKIFTNGNYSNVLFSSVGTVLHEIGHYIHFEILSEEDIEELESIFNDGTEVEELYKLTDDKYCKTDVYEFWSELVAYYYSYRENDNIDGLSRSFTILDKYFKN